MQIGANTTGMPAGLTVAPDKDGRDWCVVIVKGTFAVGRDGAVTPAEEQHPLVYIDEHLGDPASTSIRHECEFARFKPKADVILLGHAAAVGGRPVKEMDVTLEVGEVRKKVHAVGDRVWEGGLTGARSSEPRPFDLIPLIYERAFGGGELNDPDRVGTELRNPVGVGFFENRNPQEVVGKPLPNFEPPGQPLRELSKPIEPAGFGVLGRSWKPRIDFGGTYDQKWMDERLPFLPADFDERYFQSTPADQQTAFLGGGERIVCTGVRSDRPLRATVPTVAVPITFRFRDRDVNAVPRLDTLIIEADADQLILVWRTQTVLGRKFNALREVLIGPQPVVEPAETAETAGGKRRYGSLADLLRAKRERAI